MRKARHFDLQGKESQLLRRLIMPMMVILFLVTFTTRAVIAAESNGQNDGRQGGTYAIGLWGDLPYSTAQATVGVPNLIADMTAPNLAITVHDGALKSGSSECKDS